jgi:hypothetical protein
MITPQLIKSLLLAAAVGFFILWILEVFRTDLSQSYWLILLSLLFLFLHQYYRLRLVSPKPKSTPAPHSQKVIKPKKK